MFPLSLSLSQVINRSKLPSMLEAGDFLIQLPPSTTNGEGVNVDLEKLNQTTENESYYIGYPVVTDDEGKRRDMYMYMYYMH